MKKLTLLFIICVIFMGCEKQESAMRAIITNSDINEFVNGYNKMEAAIAVYYARNDRFPDSGTDGAIDLGPFYESGLRPADLRFKEHQHKLYLCNKTGIAYPSSYKICVVSEVPQALACSLEVLKDDANYNTGSGRIKNPPNFTTPCDLTDKSLVSYVYKLF